MGRPTRKGKNELWDVVQVCLKYVQTRAHTDVQATGDDRYGLGLYGRGMRAASSGLSEKR